METLVEVNRVLVPGGVLIFDVNEYSSMPIVQTVNPETFSKWVTLFGFELIERRKFDSAETHARVAYAYEKYEEFDFRRFLMPQCCGSLNNFLPKRDWFLR